MGRRPRYGERMERLSVRLTTLQRAVAQRHGAGRAADGVRAALDDLAEQYAELDRSEAERHERGEG